MCPLGNKFFVRPAGDSHQGTGRPKSPLSQASELWY